MALSNWYAKAWQGIPIWSDETPIKKMRFDEAAVGAPLEARTERSEATEIQGYRNAMNETCRVL